MFGRHKAHPAGPDAVPPPPPEGQAAYIPIDDASDLPTDTPSAGAVGESDQLLATLRCELDEINDKWKRTLADFQNYQRRAHQNEQEARRQAVAAVVMSVVPVLDHFDVALNQNIDSAGGAAAGILEGVRVIRAELIKALEKHGVSIINPARNDPFDPMRHEAITQQAAEGVEPGHIAATFQPGFELGDRPIRSAKVAVAPGA